MDNSIMTKNQTTKSFVLISSLAAAAVLVASMGSSVASYAVQPRVDLGLAESFAVLAGSGITNTGPTTASGSAGADFGSSPTGTFTGDVQVTTSGTKYTAVDAAVTAAKVDLTTAYNDAAGRTPATTVTADLGGQTLTAGVYNSASSLAVTGTLTLDAENDPDAVFIFQAGSTLTSASSARVALINGADACNVFWQVGSSATFGTDTVFVGHVLALTSITANTRATFEGQLLARNGAVTLDTNTITNNLCDTVTPSATPSASASASETAEAEAPVAESKTTDIGGQLPSTDAFDWVNPLVIGLGVIALATGGYLIWRRRNPESK
jgi:LPXTG-motif cell wall-anchored protein